MGIDLLEVGFEYGPAGVIVELYTIVTEIHPASRS